jgi:hypothetical protein
MQQPPRRNQQLDELADRTAYSSWRSRDLSDYTGHHNSRADGNGYVEVSIPPEGYVALAS